MTIKLLKDPSSVLILNLNYIKAHSLMFLLVLSTCLLFFFNTAQLCSISIIAGNLTMYRGSSLYTAVQYRCTVMHHEHRLYTTDQIACCHLSSIQTVAAKTCCKNAILSQ